MLKLAAVDPDDEDGSRLHQLPSRWQTVRTKIATDPHKELRAIDQGPPLFRQYSSCHPFGECIAAHTLPASQGLPNSSTSPKEAEVIQQPAP